MPTELVKARFCGTFPPVANKDRECLVRREFGCRDGAGGDRQEGNQSGAEGRRFLPICQSKRIWNSALISGATKPGIRKDIDKVFERFPRLGERRKQIAGTLSGGEQQMLAIGRGLMSQPRLLLLDEPSMGLALLLVKEIFSIIKEINASGTTILPLVEQNANMAPSIAHQAYVLETGRITLSGSAKRTHGKRRSSQSLSWAVKSNKVKESEKGRRKMFVAKANDSNPKVIESTATIADASEMMRKYKIRRLPVVDDGRLLES